MSYYFKRQDTVNTRQHIIFDASCIQTFTQKDITILFTEILIYKKRLGFSEEVSLKRGCLKKTPYSEQQRCV